MLCRRIVLLKGWWWSMSERSCPPWLKVTSWWTDFQHRGPSCKSNTFRPPGRFHVFHFICFNFTHVFQILGCVHGSDDVHKHGDDWTPCAALTKAPSKNTKTSIYPPSALRVNLSVLLLLLQRQDVWMIGFQPFGLCFHSCSISGSWLYFLGVI